MPYQAVGRRLVLVWDSNNSNNRYNRGGSWSSDAYYCDVSLQGGYYAYNQYIFIGFRLLATNCNNKSVFQDSSVDLGSYKGLYSFVKIPGEDYSIGIGLPV